MGPVRFCCKAVGERFELQGGARQAAAGLFVPQKALPTLHFVDGSTQRGTKPKAPGFVGTIPGGMAQGSARLARGDPAAGGPYTGLLRAIGLAKYCPEIVS